MSINPVLAHQVYAFYQLVHGTQAAAETQVSGTPGETTFKSGINQDDV